MHAYFPRGSKPGPRFFFLSRVSWRPLLSRVSPLGRHPPPLRDCVSSFHGSAPGSSPGSLLASKLLLLRFSSFFSLLRCREGFWPPCFISTPSLRPNAPTGLAPFFLRLQDKVFLLKRLDLPPLFHNAVDVPPRSLSARVSRLLPSSGLPLLNLRCDEQCAPPPRFFLSPCVRQLL